MADIVYYETGYLEDGYFVYTADAVVGFTPYIASQYINSDFFEDRGGAFTLTGSLTRQTYQEFAAGLTSAFTLTGIAGRKQSAVATLTSAFTVSATVVKTVRAQTALTSAVTVATTSQKTARSSVTLTSIANVAAQADNRTRSQSAAFTSAFTQTASATSTKRISATLSSVATQTSPAIKTARASIALTSAFSPVITAIASVSNGSNLQVTATVSALVGVIKQPRIGQATGVDATTEPSPNASPYLRFGTDDTETPVDGNWYATGVATTDKFVMSLWMVNPIGFVFDADPNTKIYLQNNSRWETNSIQIETESGEPYFIYYGNTGYVRFFLGPGQRNEILNKYSHYLFHVDLSQSTNAGKYRLFKDGEQVAISEVHSISGIGPGLFDIVRTTPYDIPMTAYGQYNLMMNTSNYPDSTDKISTQGANGGGYGDSNGQKNDRGGLTQFWWDYGAASYDIDNSVYRAKFYDGNYRDLGDTGTATGLAQPKHYVRLLDYQDIEEQGTQRSVQQRWAWKLQVLVSENGVSRRYRQDNYTATTDQNSSNFLNGIRAVFSLTAQPQNVVVTTATLTASATVSATVTRILRSTVTLTSAATVTASALKVIGVSASLTSAVTVTATGTRLRYAASSLASAASFTATAYKVTPYASALTSAVTVSAAATRITRTTTTVTAIFTVVARPTDRTRDAVALEAGAFTVTASATRTRSITQTITAVATVTCAINKIKPMGSDLTAAFTVTASPKKVIVSTGNFTARFTIAPILVYRAIIAQASLSASGFVLSQGDILNFDPCREIKVDQETRLSRVKPESRLLIVESETRALKVAQETRVLRVDFETRVNITQC